MSLLFGVGTKTCRNEMCGKTFVPAKFQTNRQRFCCAQCRVNWNYKHKFYPKHRQRAKWVRRRCPGCHIEFQMSGRGKGTHQRYCTKNCRSAHHMREKRKKERASLEAQARHP